MELSENNRMLLLKGLDALIEIKEAEIEMIQEKTEKDYPTRILQLAQKDFSLELAKEREVNRKRKEIDEMKNLKETFNNTRNRMLVVPNYVQLTLNLEEKRGERK